MGLVAHAGFPASTGNDALFIIKYLYRSFLQALEADRARRDAQIKLADEEATASREQAATLSDEAEGLRRSVLRHDEAIALAE